MSEQDERSAQDRAEARAGAKAAADKAEPGAPVEFPKALYHGTLGTLVVGDKAEAEAALARGYRLTQRPAT